MHGPRLDFNNDGTLRMLDGFVHDEPADGTYRFYRTGELFMVKLTANANAAYGFSYSLDGRETGQLYVWRGRGYEGTVLAINLESKGDTLRGWISAYAGGRRVHDEECDLDGQFYPVLKAPLPEYYRRPESGPPTDAPPPSSPRAIGEKATSDERGAPDAR